MRILEPSSSLSLDSLFSDIHLWTAEMMENGVLSLVPTEIILDVIQKNANIGKLVMQELMSMLIESEKERASLAQCIVRERMIKLLQMLSDTYGIKTDKGVKININLTREEIAELIGTASETAIRLLKELRDDKTVFLKGKEITISNPILLQKLCDLV